MKIKFALALALASNLAGFAHADTLSLPGTHTGTLGTSETFTSSGLTVTAYGFWINGMATDLYGKTSGGSETGLGLASTYEHEIDDLSFIQFNVSSLPSAVSFNIGSTQSDEGFSVYGSNTLGSLGTQLANYMMPSSDPFATGSFSGYKYLSITADGNQGHRDNGQGNVLVNSLSTAATPEPNSLVLLGTGALGLAGALKRRRFSL